MTLLNTAAGTVSTQEVQGIVSLVQQMETELNERYLERSQIVRGMLVALVSRQHVFLLGPAGEGKTGVIEALCERIGASYFDNLVRALMAEEEVFGPLKVSKLEQDVYERQTEGMLPEANVAFLDEIWKGSSAVLNGTLKIINERKFRNNGWKTVPLTSLFCASNEMPQEDSLLPLWDRIILRYKVNRLSEPAMRLFVQEELKRHSLMALGQDTSGKTGTGISLEQLETLQKAALTVEVNQPVLEDLFSILAEIDKKGKPLPSTRKTGWLLQLVKANALLNGRLVATSDDLSILAHVLWEREEDIRDIAAIVMKIANPMSSKAQELGDQGAAAFSKFAGFLRDNPKATPTQKGTQLTELRAALNELADHFKALEQQATGAGKDLSEIKRVRLQMRELWMQGHKMVNVEEMKI